MSPSLFLLGWMAAIGCLLPQPGRAGLAAVLLSVSSSLLAMVFEAGRLEAGAEKGRRDVILQLLAMAAFIARLAVLGASLR